MVDFVSMGAMLCSQRVHKGITQEKAAEIVGVSVETVRNIEHGYTIPNMATVFALWDIYCLPKENIWAFYFRSDSVKQYLSKFGIDTVCLPKKELESV